MPLPLPLPSSLAVVEERKFNVVRVGEKERERKSGGGGGGDGATIGSDEVNGSQENVESITKKFLLRKLCNEATYLIGRAGPRIIDFVGGFSSLCLATLYSLSFLSFFCARPFIALIDEMGEM